MFRLLLDAVVSEPDVPIEIVFENRIQRHPYEKAVTVGNPHGGNLGGTPGVNQAPYEMNRYITGATRRI